MPFSLVCPEVDGILTMRIIKYVLAAAAIILLLALGGFTAWAYTPLGPMPEAVAALESDEQVQVETSPWLTFTPQEGEPSTGFILYPGGRVDPRSYAPTAHAIAAEGYLVVIPPMPFNLAVFDANAAADIIAAHPQISSWAIGGHSLGGAMAASFAGGEPSPVDALILWAAYPASSLASRDDFTALSIFGSNDGVATVEDIDASRPLLPPDTRWEEISGGNHAQFGWYGPQPGDGQATISRPEQQEQIVARTVETLQQIASAGR